MGEAKLADEVDPKDVVEAMNARNKAYKNLVKARTAYIKADREYSRVSGAFRQALFAPLLETEKEMVE